MDDYEIKDYKLLGSVSSIKSSLFDITSLLNVKILDLDEEIKQDNDPRKIQIKEELNNRLKNIIELSDSFYDEIIEIDKSFDGIDNEVVLENKDIKIDSITKEIRQITNPNDVTPEEDVQSDETPAEVDEDIDEDDDTIEISDKAIDDLINIDGKDEDDITEVDLEDEEETEVKEESSDETAEEKVEEEKAEESTEEVKEEASNDEESVEEETEVKEDGSDETSEEKVEEEKVEESTEKVKEETSNDEESVEEETEVKEEVPTEEVKEDINDTDKSIAEQKEKVTKKEISYIINKDNIDPAKAILVTSLQYEKLLLSRDEQKTLCKLRKYMIMPGEKEKQEMNLEEMLSKAENLYKEGKTSEAEELYNKISDLNRK